MTSFTHAVNLFKIQPNIHVHNIHIRMYNRMFTLFYHKNDKCIFHVRKHRGVFLKVTCASIVRKVKLNRNQYMNMRSINCVNIFTSETHWMCVQPHHNIDPLFHHGYHLVCVCVRVFVCPCVCTCECVHTYMCV